MTAPPTVPPSRELAPGGGSEGGRPPERVVLVGFMAAGKTTVGRLLARKLGYRFVDLDRRVEERAGRAIPEIFEAAGEEHFRALEAEVTGDLDRLELVVVAAGGGWMAREELRERWPGAVRVWLRVRPGTVVERLAGELTSRPMLDPEAPERSAEELLRQRRPAYARAELAVETDDLTPEEVAAEIHRLLVSV